MSYSLMGISSGAATGLKLLGATTNQTNVASRVAGSDSTIGQLIEAGGSGAVTGAAVAAGLAASTAAISAASSALAAGATATSAAAFAVDAGTTAATAVATGAGVGSELGPIGAAAGVVVGVMVAIGLIMSREEAWTPSDPIGVFNALLASKNPLMIVAMKNPNTALALCSFAGDGQNVLFNAWLNDFYNNQHNAARENIANLLREAPTKLGTYVYTAFLPTYSVFNPVQAFANAIGTIAYVLNKTLPVNTDQAYLVSNYAYNPTKGFVDTDVYHRVLLAIKQDYDGRTQAPLIKSGIKLLAQQPAKSQATTKPTFSLVARTSQPVAAGNTSVLEIAAAAVATLGAAYYFLLYKK